MFTRSAITPPKVNGSDEIWSTESRLLVADFADIPSDKFYDI